ncbi:MAG: TetR/AcrR family transcriptional regulator, partial [Desulfomonilaceae bacterium]
MKKDGAQHVAPAENSGLQRIVAAARRHFFTYGFRAITMDDLARELGMSKKTLYMHFPSKVALVEAVLFDKVRNVESDLKRITSNSSSDFLTTLHQLLARVQMHLDEIQPPFLRDLRREAPEMFSLVETRRREMIHQYF